MKTVSSPIYFSKGIEEDLCVEKYTRWVRMRLGPNGAVRYIYKLWFKVIHNLIQGELLLAGLLGSRPIRSGLLPRSLVLDTVAGVGAHS